jgi:thioredoxin-like negative regulator of GroEL
MVAETIQTVCRRAHDFRSAGHLDAAESEYRRILEFEPHYEEAALSLAFMLRQQGLIGAACKVVLSYWLAAERSASHDLKAIKFLIECGRHGDAQSIA